VGECGQNDDACVQACVNSASEEGYNQLVAVVECAQVSCPELDQACLEQSCGAELAACQ
jgi:nicotinamidase-related amidase